MKNLSIIFSLVVLVSLSSCGDSKPVVTADYNVIPLPQSINMGEGEGFTVKSSTKIVYPAGNEKLQKTAQFLSEYIQFATGMTLAATDKETADNGIILRNDYANENKEAYNLKVDSKSAVINGASDAAVFYGVQTLRKSIPVDSTGVNILLPAVDIQDYPRFGYRGMHLDVGRHMFPVEFIKQYIDVLALHNINIFHWHLTEDQGWRIEIKKYPELTEIGSMRKGTVIGRWTPENQNYDNVPYGGFYTQDEAREIVQYAADRFITVIPEIDLPGHMLAALTAYPELGCTGGPYEVGMRWGVLEDILCAGNDQTFEFLENVFTEILDIFPSEYIHIGGDEAPKVRWEKCPKCQARIKELGLKSDKAHTKEQRLQSYTISRVEKFLNDHGRQIIGWTEILEGGLAPNATVMSWLGKDGAIEAARLGHNVIMCPYQVLYFDYQQGKDPGKEPVSIGGYTSVEKVYNYEPVAPELTDEQKKYIIGVQANIWTEYIKDSKHVEYMQMPRIDALSEIQWTNPSKKDFEGFKVRLGKMVKLYDKYGYNYARHVFEGN